MFENAGAGDSENYLPNTACRYSIHCKADKHKKMVN